MSSFLWDRIQHSQSHPYNRRPAEKRSDTRSLLSKAAAVLFVFALLCPGSNADRLSAEKKVSLIKENRWPISRSISFSSSELLALGLSGISDTAPGVISRPVLSLRNNGATATALVDFDLLRKSYSGQDSMNSWLASKLFTGQHPVSVTVHVASGNGQMTVHPESVAISGMTVSGDTLHFLLQQFILPRYPDAVIDRPFALQPNIREIRVTPGAAEVFRK